MTEGWINKARKYVDKREVTAPNRLPILFKRRQKSGEGLTLDDLLQGLVDNEATIRDRALDALPEFLAGFGEAEAAAESAEAGKKKQPEPFARLWNGLIMCYWHTDRPLTQLDVANRIAGLVHRLPSQRAQVHWVRHFFQAVCDAWSKLDTHRIDKYLSLIRRVLCDAFRLLKQLPDDQPAAAEEGHGAEAAGAAAVAMEAEGGEGKGKKSKNQQKQERRRLRERLQQEEEQRRLRVKPLREEFWEVMRSALASEMVSIAMHLADIWLDEGIEAGLPTDLYTQSLQLWLEVLREPSALATHALLRVFAQRCFKNPSAPIDRDDLIRRVRTFADSQIKTKQQLAYFQILHNLDALDQDGEKAIMKWHPTQLRQERQDRHERAKRVRKATMKPRKTPEERAEEALLEKKRGARRGHRTKGVGPSRVKGLSGRTIMRNTVVDLL